MGAGPLFVFDVLVLPGQIYRGEPTEVAMKVAFGFSGGLLIESLQQTNDGPSVFTEMLDRHGDGYHHVVLRIPYDQGVDRRSGEGYAMAWIASSSMSMARVKAASTTSRCIASRS